MTTKRKQRIKGPEGLELLLDANEIVPDNPGDGTPAMVILRGRQFKEIDSGTFNCAHQTGELSSECTSLSDAQCAWLDKMEPVVDAFLTQHGG